MNNLINLYFATHDTCNMNCRYCYIPREKRTQPKYSDEDILFSLNEFLQKAERENILIGTFCFHGTEPSLMSADTLAEGVQMVNEFRRDSGSPSKRTSIQTNGLNFTDEYLDELEPVKNNLLISFSIDPPKQVHDFYRAGSYDKIYSNYLNCIDRGFAVSVLSVVSKNTLAHPDDFAIWMKTELMRQEHICNPHKVKIKFATGDDSLDDDDFREFGYFLLDNDLAGIAQLFTPGYCIHYGNECSWYEFDINGNCYSCNKNYMPEGIFANWQKEPFAKIIAKREKLFRKYPEHKECSACEYEYLCNSGCPADRIKSGINKGKSHECMLIKTVYDAVQKKGGHIVDFFNGND